MSAKCLSLVRSAAPARNRADGDDEVGQGKHVSSAIKLPGKFLGGGPDAMIGRHMGEQIKKGSKLDFDHRTSHSAQNFATNDAAADQVATSESFYQLMGGSRRARSRSM